MDELIFTNMSLSAVKIKNIESLDAKNDVAIFCRKHLQVVINEMLAEYDWSFARKRQALNQLTGITYAQWAYVYDMPDGMVEPRKVCLPDTDHNVDYLIEGEYEYFFNSETADKAHGRLATDYNEIELVYTTEITAVDRLPPSFLEALVYLFGHRIGMKFGGMDRAQSALAVYRTTQLPRAIHFDAKRERPSVKGGYLLLDRPGRNRERRSWRQRWPNRYY